MQKSYIKSDIIAGIIVFLVALPLCLGIALASGAPLISGIISGVIGGIIVTLFSNSSIGVSGPAAGLAVIVFTAIQQLGYSAFLMAVVLSGVLQLAMGFAKLGFITKLFPKSIIKGMLAGIGISIIFTQGANIVGTSEIKQNVIAAFQQGDIMHFFESIHVGAFAIFIVSFAILILFDKFKLNQNKYLKFFPAPLWVVILGIVSNVLLDKFAPGFSLSNTINGFMTTVSIPVIENFSDVETIFQLPDFGSILNSSVIATAILISLVGSIETLLCVEAADDLDPLKRKTNSNKELKAQGIGNIFSGLIGGLPITQVIVRSATNVSSGGKTRLSAFVHGITLLVCVAFLGATLNLIPLAALAAILLHVGYKLASKEVFKAHINQGKYVFIPFAVTAFGIVATDMLKGISLGILAHIILYVIQHINHPFKIHNEKDINTYRIVLSNNVSFVHRWKLIKAVENLPNTSTVIVDGSKSFFHDRQIPKILADLKKTRVAQKAHVEFIGIPYLNH
ncbi:SulP family inorganic anion transporter [Halosquirtibacter laminarini]|uniref:SulP family inorganic anion transporter n=1 Tax=Halosquirtibacter laminarini TaxID=3374600 RepID=A0AC61NH52_9BACT|nr:SulP family inorganic anion transporter [Prolixibacteraceae bacterium]